MGKFLIVMMDTYVCVVYNVWEPEILNDITVNSFREWENTPLKSLETLVEKHQSSLGMNQIMEPVLS